MLCKRIPLLGYPTDSKKNMKACHCFSALNNLQRQTLAWGLESLNSEFVKFIAAFVLGLHHLSSAFSETDADAHCSCLFGVIPTELKLRTFQR